MSEDEFIFEDALPQKKSVLQRLKDLKDQSLQSFREARAQKKDLNKIYKDNLHAQRQLVAKAKAAEDAQKTVIGGKIARFGRFAKTVRKAGQDIAGTRSANVPGLKKKQKKNRSARSFRGQATTQTPRNNLPPMFR